MITVGLTGGVASGKSTARRVLEENGARTIDADLLGHQAYEPGTECFARVVATFGDKVVGADGKIDRKALGQIVFSSPESREKLQDIVWPQIKAMIKSRLAGMEQQGVEIVVIEAAIMLEAGWEDAVDYVWVVCVDPEVARSRLMARNNLTEEQADQRIASQMSNEERIAKADAVFHNNGGEEEFRMKVSEALLQLKKQDA